jgi:hypothetical protein
VTAVQNFELVWMDILCKIINSTFVADRVLESRPWSVADCPPGGRGPSGPLARTVRPLARTVRTLAEQCSSIPFYCGDWYQLFIYGCLSHYCSGFGGLRKKLAGRFKSKRPRGDDADYTPTTDSEAQSSAGALNLWILKTFLMFIPLIPLTPQDGHIQSGGFLWLSTAQGGL